jgi:tRNA G18 (ribose-2'-O)-methylase SpoU
MRGYFGVGVEEISKPMNLGALMRTAHAFGASFFFTINAAPKIREAYNANTSRIIRCRSVLCVRCFVGFQAARGCTLVGVELTDEAVELPRFRRPSAAAYVFGRERGSLSPDLLGLCASGAHPNEILCPM